MKRVAFFQPYLANWRIEFLDSYIKNSSHEITVYDGGFSGRSDSKSVTGNSAPFKLKKLKSTSPVIRYKNQEYPLYFSPLLIFSLIKDRPDVVITEGEINFLNNISIYLYSKIFNKKYVWWSLGKVRTRQKNAINRLLDPIVDFLLKNSSCIMARNSLAKEYYEEQKKINPNKVIVAPNSMDDKKARTEIDQNKIDSLRQGCTGSKILYVGALTKQKRPSDLVIAFKEVLASGMKYNDAQLWFVGDGPERGNLEALASNLGIIDKVRFFGKIFDGVGNYFSAADVVVVPGLGGLVINHAMIFGKPVISRLADGTELDLVINDKTGYLLEDYDNSKMAEAIKKSLEPEKLSSMSKNAKSLVEASWNIETMTSRVNDCITMCLER